MITRRPFLFPAAGAPGRLAGVGRAVLVALALLALAPGSAAAQEAPSHDDVLSANPFLALFEWFNVEWEHRIRPTGTLGVAGSYLSLDGDDDEYTNLALFYRYYPQEEAPGGFFLGPRVSLHRVEVFDGQTEKGAGLGLEIGYTWLLGSDRSFALSLGGGVTRILALEADATGVIPTVRLVNVGWAF